MAKTLEGKAISARNAYRHGAKSAETCAVRSWLKGIRTLVRQVQYPADAVGREQSNRGGTSNHNKVISMKDTTRSINIDVNSRAYQLAMVAFNQDSEALQSLMQLAEQGDIEAEHYLFHPEEFFDPCMQIRR